ncbi:S-layer homology domain-containing protein, partial [Anoxybacillus flavithermus]|uniref:S-layer homology domain-containing protein n=1 Tax=Anoxybacillus flavithermus TaxID=33934 RepID=UPI0018665EA1
MAYQPKSYRKFLAGTVSAAVVASAIAPVASASFTDVAGSVHADDIATLVAKGYIKGYADGTFKPNKPLTRGEAAIIFSRILKDAGVKAPEQGAGFPDVPASKAELAEAVAIVKAAGVMGGDEKGNFNPNANITREQMAKVVVEAFKLTKPANHTSKVTDLDKAGAWAREYIQVLEANGVTKNTEFAPKQNVTRGQFASFVVRAMNVKKEVSAADITAVKLVDEKTLEVTFNGELKEVKKEDFAIQGVEIDSVSIKAAEAKTTVVVIKTKTALQEGKSYNVSYKGQTTDKAKVDVPVVTPKVESVSANNLKNIVVKFNREVEKKTITSSNVKVYDGNTLLSGVTLNLLDDNKTLLITNNGSYSQLKEYKVVVENVEVKGDSTKKVEKAEKTVSVVDTTLPTVESVTATSPKTLEIVFSEPIQTGSGAGQFPTSAAVLTDIVQIDGINAYATPTLTDIDTKNKVVLTLNTALTAGNHKIKVANLKDYANLPIAAKEFTVNIPADTTAPEVTAVEVLNKDKVKVTFNEPVDNATVQSNLANIKVNGTAVKAATAKEGGKVYELTLGSSLNLAAVVEAKLEYKGIKDNYGNEVKDAKTFIFKAVDDTTAPTVTDVKVNSDNTIEVTFSEDVTGFTGTNTVELYDKDNKKLSNTVTVAKKVIDGVPSDKVYVLTITDGSSLSGAHTIKILKDNVTDLSIRTNKFAEATFPVTLNDKVAPTITKVEYVNETDGTDFNSDADVKDSKVTIYFSEAMDVATLTNKANYLINSTPLADVPGTVTLTPAGDNKSVTITVNRGSSDTQLTFANNTDLRVIAVKDAAGNTLSSTQVNANLGKAGLISKFVSDPAFTEAVDKVEVISKNQLKLYAKSGYLFSGIDANKIKFTEDKNATALIPGLQVTAVSIAADGKTATLTLNNNVTADGKFDGSDADTVANVVSLYADADAITLTNGAKTAALEATSGLNVIDKTAPSISTVTKHATNADTIVLTFDEPVSFSNSVGLAGDLVVKLADGTVLNPAAGDYTVADSVPGDEKLEIKIVKPGVKDANVTVELKDGRYITDSASNVATTFTVKDVMDRDNKARITEKTAPTKAVTADSDWSTPGQVTIKFSEPVKGFTIEDITAVKASTKETLTFGTGASVAAVDSDSNGYATTWVVNFGKDADVTLATVDTVRVDATKVLDLAGNPAGTTGAFITFTAKLPIAAKEFTVNIPADTTAPEVTAVEVLNKDKVKVTFNEPVDNATVQSNLANIKVN